MPIGTAEAVPYKHWPVTDELFDLSLGFCEI